MKNVKMIISAFAVIAVVSGALAFRVPGMKLYQCNTHDVCALTDGSNDYQFDGSGVFKTQATLATITNPPVGTCEDACPDTIQVSTEIGQ
jgi:hypothetical protein